MTSSRGGRNVEYSLFHQHHSSYGHVSGIWHHRVVHVRLIVSIHSNRCGYKRDTYRGLKSAIYLRTRYLVEVPWRLPKGKGPHVDHVFDDEYGSSITHVGNVDIYQKRQYHVPSSQQPSLQQRYLSCIQGRIRSVSSRNVVGLSI